MELGVLGAQVGKLLEKFGPKVDVRVNHEEILVVAYREAATDVDGELLYPAYVDINSIGELADKSRDNDAN